MEGSRLRTICFRASLVGLFLLVIGSSIRAADVLRWHNDACNHGLNDAETALTPANVNDRFFGKLFTFPTDGYAYAQPLVVSDLDFGGKVGKRTAVFVATEHDSVYALDAAGNNGESSVLWHASLIDPDHRVTPVPSVDVRTQDLVPEIGITSTPAIDRDSNTIFVVTRTKEVRLMPSTPASTRPTTQASTQATTQTATQPVRLVDTDHWVQRLHALDLLTGSEKFGSPVLIGDSYRDARGTWHDETPVRTKGTGNGSVDGILRFNALREHQRSGLLLDHGRLYVDYASHGDVQPVHGWILAFDAHSFHLLATLSTSPNGSLATSWMAGASPAVDTNGNLYFATGNGEFTAANGGHDYGESVLRVDTHEAGSGTLSVADYFTPSNFDALNAHDLDLGSGGVMLLPDVLAAATTQPIHRHRLIVGGKEGILFLLDPDHLGGLSPGPVASDGHAVQILKSLGHLDSPTHHEINIINTPACFNGWLYYTSRSDPVTQFQIERDGTLRVDPIHRATDHFNFAPPTPSISSNGDHDGIVWAINNGVPATLLAYDAIDVSHKLYDSNSTGSRDRLDGGVKFSLPTIANGKVFVGTQDNLTVFGLLPASKIRPADPTNLVATVVDAHHIDLTWQLHSADETGVRIERAMNDEPFHPLDTTGHGTSSYADRASVGAGHQLLPEMMYRYRIATSNAAGDSHWVESARITTPAAPPDPALVGHWPMDEGTGPHAADVASNPDDGVVRGEVVWVHGHVGTGALGFHGAGVAPGYVEIPDAPKLRFGEHDSFTISAWVEPAAPPDKWAAIVARAGEDVGGIGLWSDNQNHWVFGTPTGSHNVVGGVATVGWHHIVGVQDGKSNHRLLFVDGVQAGDVAGAFDAGAAGDLWIGGSKSDETKFIDARIDDVRVYNRALTPSDAADLFVYHNPPPATHLIADAEPGKPTRLKWLNEAPQAGELPSMLRVERSIAGSPFSLLQRLSGNSDRFVDADLPANPGACAYRIVAENKVGESEPITAEAHSRLDAKLIRSVAEHNAAHSAVVSGGWHEGDRLFVDRDFVTPSTVAQPNAAGTKAIDLTGADVIHTANDDKRPTDYDLSYTLAADADVYLLIDERTIATPGMPAGAESFTDTHTQIDFGAPGIFEVFHSHESAGSYTLHSHVSNASFFLLAALPAH